MKWLITLLIILLIVLQAKLWLGDGSIAEVHQLGNTVALQQQKNKITRERNLALEAEVKDLKKGLDAVEERARSELGMIKNTRETFYQIVERKSPQTK